MVSQFFMVITPWAAPLGGDGGRIPAYIREGHPAFCNQGFSFQIPLEVQIPRPLPPLALNHARANFCAVSSAFWRPNAIGQSQVAIGN